MERLGRKWARAKLPKLGWVCFRWSRPLGGEIRSAAVSRKTGRWYVSFLVDDGTTTPERHAMPNTSVGIDRGVKTAAVTSDGDFHDREFITAGEAGRFRRLQQQLARTKKGSANRAKVRARMNRITGRVTDRRADFCAQVAQQITAKNAVVVLEDLKTRNMSASASGAVDAPGTRVSQKWTTSRMLTRELTVPSIPPQEPGPARRRRSPAIPPTLPDRRCPADGRPRRRGDHPAARPVHQ